jgi:hypothetical protein
VPAFSCLGIGDRHCRIGVGVDSSQHVDDDQRNDKTFNRHQGDRQSSFEEMVRRIDVRSQVFVHLPRYAATPLSGTVAIGVFLKGNVIFGTGM